MSAKIKQALCCTCGQLRTFKRARNEVTDCGIDNVTWHRCTGDLKCSNCGTITRHALLREDNGYQDYAETYQAIALGRAPDQYTDAERIRREYHQGLPRNLFINHTWWKSAENDARKAGKTHFQAMCGALVEVPEHAREGRDVTEMKAPTQLTNPEKTEHENLDVDTGLWWSEAGACVNCLRVRNDWVLAERRKKMGEWFTWLYLSLDKRVPDEHVEVLIAAFEATQQKNKDT